MTNVKNLSDILADKNHIPQEPWNLKAIQNEDCLGYIAWNTNSQEALIIDPKLEDKDAILKLVSELKNYTWLAVIDTHTHADHISLAAEVAITLKTPLIMHEKSGSSKPQIRISKDTHLSSKAGPLKFFTTPGHTIDSLTVLWGPFLFAGDTILYGDTGRDDLPSGNAEAHFESIEKLKNSVSKEAILLPGHDNKGGRASTWGEQLKINSSLTQTRVDFVKDSLAFDGQAPKLLKKSLFENLK